MRVSVGYPDHDAEVRVLQGEHAGTTPDSLEPVLDLRDLVQVIARVHDQRVDPQLASYVVQIAAATREHPDVRLGASPRGSLALVRTGRAYAATEGRSYVTPDDIKAVAGPVLAHRLILEPEAELRGRTPAAVVDEVLSQVSVPGALAVGLG
jgi:MoxR-like ATPase